MMGSVEILFSLLPIDFRTATLKEILDKIPSPVMDAILESPDRNSLCEFLGICFMTKRPPLPIPDSNSPTVFAIPFDQVKSSLREFSSRVSICLRAAWCERRGLATVTWPAAINESEPPKITAYPNTSKQCVDAFTRDGLKLQVHVQDLGTIGRDFKRNDPRYS